ncbi:MAG: PDZ domain-containing protein [Chromatiaceae bacterium]|jgi:S1-C subfamily serine protease
MDQRLLLGRTPALFAFLILVIAAAATVPVHAAGRPSLGLLIDSVPFGQLHEMGLSHGVAVRGLVTGGPAENAGIRPGDIIVEMNKDPVYSPDQMEWLVTHLGPNDKAKLTYVRDHEKNTITVEPAAAVSGELTPYESPMQAEAPSGQAYLGIAMQPLTGDLGAALGAPSGQGVLVAEVAKGGPAAKAGIRAGDILIGIGKKKIRGAADVYRALNYFEPGENVDLEIVRAKKTETLAVKLGENPDAGMMWHGGSGPHRFPGQGPMGPYGGYLPPNFDEYMRHWMDCMENWRGMRQPQWHQAPQRHPGYNL